MPFGAGPPGGGITPPFAGAPIAGPSRTQSATPEEEREAITQMALEELAAKGNIRSSMAADATPPELLRDQALQEVLERGERLRQESARRLREQQAKREQRATKREEQAEQGKAAPKSAARRGPARRGSAPKQGDLDHARAVLEDVSGLGPARVEALLETFGGLETLRAADRDELTAVEGIGPALARKIAVRVGRES